MVETIDVKTIFGLGWGGTPGAPVEPAPFSLVIERRRPARGRIDWAIGRVASPGHPLNGWYAYLSGRHVEPTNSYAVAFFAARPPLSKLGEGWSPETNALKLADGYVELG